MNVVLTTSRRGTPEPATPAAELAAPKSLINDRHSNFSRFSRLVDDSNMRLGMWGYVIGYRGLTVSPAEPAEPARIVPSQWVRDRKVVAAPPAPCCTQSVRCCVGRIRHLHGRPTPLVRRWRPNDLPHKPCHTTKPSNTTTRAPPLVFWWLHSASPGVRHRGKTTASRELLLR
jgi:hypothetical protein